ncbi:Thioredoxin family protein [Tritrichomonas foetus]|uniref:Thioredoxin family protein n=1 Tax=Tritrichomonas foetus TaxID=1144522 RepID=A0A1J4JA14_9EUKA|nr:Thioredoxin family protein [Tritrichomonas foetus]|eukprot:OHS96000.1 Thioredoxin family protein [Tritrichomonas foetus]
MLLFSFLSICGCFNFGPSVIELTANNFQREVEHRDNKTVYFVMFHGQHCPACQMAYPEFVEAANEAVGMVKFGHIDTSQEYALGSQFQIYSIPTFIIFHPNGQTTYNRERLARTMLNVASRFIPNLSQPVDDSWLPTNETRSVILFTDKQNTPPIWSAISCEFENNTKNIQIGFCNNATIQKEFGITAVPTILMINGEHKFVYNNKNRFQLIRKTIIDFFEGVIPDSPKPTPAPVLIDNLESQEDFENQCKGKGLFCVVQKGEEPTSEFNNAAKKYRHDHFKFFLCKPENCPFDFLKESVWIFHHRREAGIRVDNLETLGSTLDRVIDGGARFVPLEKLKTEAEEL